MTKSEDKIMNTLFDNFSFVDSFAKRGIHQLFQTPENQQNL